MLEVRSVITLNTNKISRLFLLQLQNIFMPTINQLIKKSRVKPVARNKVPALEKQPLKEEYVLKFILQHQKSLTQLSGKLLE